MSTQRDCQWKLPRELVLYEGEDFIVTAATAHADSTVFRICRHTGRRSVIGPRSKTEYAYPDTPGR